MSILYDASVIGEAEAALKYDIQKDTLIFWQRRFKLFGEKGLDIGVGQQVEFSPEEKVRILEHFRKYGMEHASNTYGVMRRSLYKWKHAIKEAGGPVDYLAKANQKQKLKKAREIYRQEGINKKRARILEENGIHEHATSELLDTENGNKYPKLYKRTTMQRKLRSLQKEIHGHWAVSKKSTLYEEYLNLISLLNEKSSLLLPYDLCEEIKTYFDTILKIYITPELAQINNELYKSMP